MRVGGTIRGELTADDADFADLVGDANEGNAPGFYDLYRFVAGAGERLRIRMETQVSGAALAVGTLSDGEFVPLARSAAAAADTGTLLPFRAPEAGEYYLLAGVSGGGTGAYRLMIQERGAEPQPRATPLRRGQTVSATLREGDPELDDGRWYDAYSYTGRAGERIRITMRSDEFDTVLILGRVVDGEFEELAENDDADDGDGTDAALVMELPADGRYVIQATSFRGQTEGAYRLTVTAPR